MEYLGYGSGIIIPFVPILTNVQLKPYALVGFMIFSFALVVQFYKKLDEKTRKSLFYLPLLFVLATFVKGRRPRIGLILIMVAMFCLAEPNLL